MTLVNVIFGVLLIAVAIFGFIVLQRRFRGDDTPLFSALGRSRKNNEDQNEIEAFIAAYRSGQADTIDFVADESDIAHAVPEGMPKSVAPTGTVATTKIADAISEGVFLRPEVKLAYLIFRSSLRDHHIFANVLLRDLGYGTAVVGKVDLLVCDNGFKYVALLDVHAGEPEEDIPKSVFLSHVGLKHLRLSTSAMPKPGQVRDLIYGRKSD